MGMVLNLDNLINRYFWDKAMSEWIPKLGRNQSFRLNGIPSTPPTRIIPDEELLYYDNSASSNQNSPSSTNKKSSPISIEIKELPADKIDVPRIGSKGSIFATFWEYLTLYWRN